eukprot:1118602-Amphidinium_carterae.1
MNLNLELDKCRRGWCRDASVFMTCLAWVGFAWLQSCSANRNHLDEVPQICHVEKIVEVLTATQFPHYHIGVHTAPHVRKPGHFELETCSILCNMEVPQVQVVEKVVEVPQVTFACIYHFGTRQYLFCPVKHVAQESYDSCTETLPKGKAHLHQLRETKLLVIKLGSRAKSHWLAEKRALRDLENGSWVAAKPC